VRVETVRNERPLAAHNYRVSRKATWVLAVGFGVWLIGPMLPGSGSGGVELRSTYADFLPQPGQLPACVSVHTYDLRSWGSWSTFRSDVWLVGCNNAAGQLRIASGPSCRATSFLGGGQATCIATPDGNKLKVTVNFVYPFGLNQVAGPKSSSTFWVDPGGGYSSTP
jgi:hypothetical protein